MSVGPLIVALTGVPVGRIVDNLGAGTVTVIGLIGITTGCLMLFVIPASFGIPGYIVPIVVITACYSMFQTANNTAVMKDVLSRNLGLITGTSVMGAVFAFASGTNDITTANPDAVAAGLRITFAVAAVLIMVALAIVIGSRKLLPFRTAF
jgi:MFS family permease